MTLPGWRDWAFALKTFAAAILALYLAMWIDLPRPHWALGTVYITSQMLAGATRAKALYRVLGTLLGAVVSVILVPNLANSPEWLTLAIAIWVALCLYLSLLDRTPRGYLLMLGGYTAALIGFPAVAEPGTMFDTGVARAEEILLGILCASLVNTVVLPRSVAPLIAERLDQWLGQARAWTAGIVRGEGDDPAARLRLASGAIALDALATPLRYDGTGTEAASASMATLRQHMLMVLPIVSALGDRADALTREGALPARARALLASLSTWIASGSADPAEAGRLRREADAVDPSLRAGSPWSDLVLASLVARMRDFIDLRQDIQALRRHVVEGVPVKGAPAFRYTAQARRIRHRDHGVALLSAVTVFLVILLTCALWIATGWPDGAGAPMMASVGCCFFAAQDDPAPSILTFAHSAILGAVVSGVYLFGVLPQATSFEMLALALAPALILCGLCMTQPRTASLAMGAAVNGSALIALQSSYTGDFAAFANSAIAVVGGMWVAVVVTRLVRSFGAGWAARRLRAINRASLARAAGRHGAESGLALAAIMLDRVGLLAPRLAALPPEEAAGTADLIGEVRVGINVVELRRGRRDLAPEARHAVEDLLAAMARDFAGEAARPPADLLAILDHALAATATAPEHPGHRAALLGLVGLRRGLFPEAAPYRPRRPAPLPTALAA
ncbi:FUSC family protein [Methylobacterium sp. J-067]|uniref:FUSC family protein n=1 Tax=Methylobacterium sp. J-067 TaxID=2836648 RepID=UPI001FB87F9B|nr:FUSC family protein [Methylobacterium sp. J-067]MCJ2026405.1 FUSC family protein [Methylobacterium sp. J-067]